MNTNLAPDPLRTEVLARLEQTAASFSDLVQAAADVRWQATPAGGSWSLAQVAEHLALVEVGTGKLMARKMFVEPAKPEALAETRDKEALLRRSLPDRVGRRIAAPEFVQPSGKFPSRDELLSAFWQWRGSTIAMLSDPARDPRLYAWDHTVWGKLDAIQWGLFLALHVDRHLDQMAQIGASLG